jgi:hypothetical protein
VKRQVKTGYVRLPSAILESPARVVAFAIETAPGRVASFMQQMTAWALMRLPITLIPHECQDQECPWKYQGTVDGSQVYQFMENWIEIIAEGEVDEDDLRVRKLVESTKPISGSPFGKLFGGNE